MSSFFPERPIAGRPDIRPKWSQLEYAFQIAAALLLVAVFVMLAVQWPSVPNNIPTHFGFDGRPDDWGSKNDLLMVPVMDAALYVLLTLAERFPRIYNFPFEITPENAERCYRCAREMLVCTKFEITLVFGAGLFVQIQTAKGYLPGLGLLFLPAFIIMFAATLVLYIRRLYRLKSPKVELLKDACEKQDDDHSDE